MIKTIVHGSSGKMGQVLVNAINEDDEMTLIAGIDKLNKDNTSYKTYTNFEECKDKADVIIDFSHYSCIPELIKYCIESNTPLVIATTALTEEHINLITEASKHIPIFQSANMSLGINVMCMLSKQAVIPLEDNYDIEIIEKHHNKKVDSPSGTAYLIADSINSTCKNKKEYIYGRHGKSDTRKITDLGIHAIRGGTIAGEHTVVFAGPDEILEIKHTALSKNVFANGAIKAAKFLINSDNGFYTMNDLLK